MTFEIEMAALGRAAAGLLLESDRMPPTSVRTAEAAQVAQYRLLHEVHRGLIGNLRKAVSVESIGQHPVAVLGRILQCTARARRTDLRASDVLAAEPPSLTDALWTSVLGHATVALADWQARPRHRPTMKHGRSSAMLPHSARRRPSSTKTWRPRWQPADGPPTPPFFGRGRCGICGSQAPAPPSSLRWGCSRRPRWLRPRLAHRCWSGQRHLWRKVSGDWPHSCATRRTSLRRPCSSWLQ